jgi:hypothetical protein
VHGAQDPHFTWRCREFYLGTGDQGIADNRRVPMLGHVGEPGRHTVEVVDEREGLSTLPHQLTGIDDHLRGGIGCGQCSDAETIIQLPESHGWEAPVSAISWYKLDCRVLWCRSHVKDQPVGTQGRMERPKGVHDAGWRNSAERPGKHHHIKPRVRQLCCGHIRDLKRDLMA